MNHQSGQYIFVNSRNRIHTVDDSSDFTVNLNTQFENVNDLSIQIQNLTIPSSWYNINANNYSIAFGTTQAIEIPQGNYSSSTFPSALQTASLALATSGISATYSALTGKMTYQSGDLAPWSITPTVKQGYLGLSAGQHASVSGVIVSDEFVDFSGPLELRLESDLAVQSANSWNRNANTLISVYPNVATGEFVNYQIEAFAPMKVSNASLNGNVRFRLFDQHGDKVDLHGKEMALTFVAYPE
jgi:hypothetical protein